MEPLLLLMTLVITLLVVTLLLYVTGLSIGPYNARFSEVCARGLQRLIYALAIVLCGSAVTVTIVAIIHLLES